MATRARKRKSKRSVLLHGDRQTNEHNNKSLAYTYTNIPTYTRFTSISLQETLKGKQLLMEWRCVETSLPRGPTHRRPLCARLDESRTISLLATSA